jgi:hypothetical protein
MYGTIKSSKLNGKRRKYAMNKKKKKVVRKKKVYKR